MVQRARLVNSLLVLCMIAFACNEQPLIMYSKYNHALLKPVIKEGLFYNADTLFTGIIYSLHPETKDTTEIVCFKKGKEEGEWKQFYARHKIKELRYFHDGAKVGRLQSWWPNGKIKWDYVFSNGEYEGNCKEWNPQGLLVKRMHYSKGHEEGLQQFFYDNGKVKANYVIVKGRRYGLLGTKNCVNVSDSIFKKL